MIVRRDLHGERAPLWDPAIRGALLGIDPSHGSAHFVRATIEGIGFELRQILDVFRAAGGARPGNLLLLKLQARMRRRSISGTTKPKASSACPICRRR